MLPCVDSPAVVSCPGSSLHLNAANRPREVWVPLWTLASHLSVPMKSCVQFHLCVPSLLNLF